MRPPHDDTTTDTPSPGSTLSAQIPSLPPLAVPLPRLTVGEHDAFTPLWRLGEGGMGTVDAAREVRLDRVVAIKRPRTGKPRIASALVAEAQVLAKLDHPNVVPVHALGADADGAPVLVMKRVEGRRWSEFEQADVERDVRIAARVADALRFAHSRGYLHRDVKLDNVMIGEFGEVFLMDWGCACSLQGASTATIVGTPTYMPPEMATIGAGIGPAVDVYLLGATLHRALTGLVRHSGATVRDVLESARRSDPLPRPEGLPTELADILDRACAADPAARPTMEQLAGLLAGFLGHRDANRVAEAAEVARQAMSDAIFSDDPRADVHFADARFGFANALAAWPECDLAQKGQESTFRSWVKWKLMRRDVATVEGALEGLPARLAGEFREDLARARKDKERQAQRVADENLALLGAERRRALLASLVLVSLLVSGIAVVTGGKPLEPVHTVLAAFGTLIAQLGTVFPIRRQIAAHRASRRLFAGYTAVMSGSLAFRLGAMLAGASTAEILRADSFLMATTLAMMALPVDPRLVVPPLALLAGALAMLIFPGQEHNIFPIAGVISVAIAAFVLSRITRDAERANV